MKALLATLLSVGALQFLAGILVREMGVLGAKLIALLRAKPKLAPLAAVVLAAEDAVDAALVAAAKNASGGTKAALKAALAAAEGAAKADEGELEDAAKAELAALVSAPAPIIAVVPGGASVNLPK